MLFKITMSAYVLLGGAQLDAYIITGSSVAASSFGFIAMCGFALPIVEMLTVASLDRKYGVRR